MGPVVEWVRSWLGVSQADARIRLLEERLRLVQLDLDQLRRNVAAAEKVAQRAAYGNGSDGLLTVLSILKRGR
jgi:hypothetical protein